MSMAFVDLQNEVKRRSTRNQGGTDFDAGIKNAINFALFRTSREAPWRSLRRKTTFDTVTSYTIGTGTATLTSGSPVATVQTANFQTGGAFVGRKVKFGAWGTYCYVNAVGSATSLVLDQTYYGTSSTAGTYEILPQCQYNLPIQAGHRLFMWHEGFGYPFRMNYITDQDFYQHGVYLTMKYIPTHYRMWGEDMSMAQISTASTVSVISSSVSDISVSITIFGKVAGYPDYETITTDSVSGLTSSAGSKSFSSIERIVKRATTVGRITVSANSGNDTLGVLPVGDTTDGILYRKIELYPLPNKVFPIWAQYYKDPYRLVNDNDVHELGSDFDEALILFSTAKMKAEQNLQTEADRFFKLWQDELRSLKKLNIDKIDWYPALRRPRQMSSDALVAPNLLYRQAGSNFGPASRL